MFYLYTIPLSTIPLSILHAINNTWDQCFTSHPKDKAMVKCLAGDSNPHYGYMVYLSEHSLTDGVVFKMKNIQNFDMPWTNAQTTCNNCLYVMAKGHEIMLGSRQFMFSCSELLVRIASVLLRLLFNTKILFLLKSSQVHTWLYLVAYELLSIIISRRPIQYLDWSFKMSLYNILKTNWQNL